jgi:hypothetical protein
MHRMGLDDLRNKPNGPGRQRRRPVTPHAAAPALTAFGRK